MTKEVEAAAETVVTTTRRSLEYMPRSSLIAGLEEGMDGDPRKSVVRTSTIARGSLAGKFSGIVPKDEQKRATFVEEDEALLSEKRRSLLASSRRISAEGISRPSLRDSILSLSRGSVSRASEVP